jgi:uncharacterized protein (UPF0333 family)
MKIGPVVLGIISAIVIMFMFINTYNYGNGVEQRLEAVWKNNKVVLSNFNKKVAEVVQVPAMARDDMVKVITAAIEGRYGAGGSKAVFQMITEQNPSVDPVLYLKIQQIIESGRDKFEGNQKELIDIQRSYQTALGSFPKGAVLRILGYPKVDLTKYKIVTDTTTEQAFDTGTSEPIKLRAE